MSASEISKFEMALAYHAAPTLMGIKCGSLLSLSSEEFDLSGLTELLSDQLADRGLHIRLIPASEKRRLVYIYSDEMLKQRLRCKAIRRFLFGYGYALELTTEQCLDRLSERLSEDEFPHEIGIFLDYPLEDVKGFIKNCGQHCKLCGVWKVYGNVERARRIFAQYHCCRAELCTQLEQGKKLAACVA
jgi:hypothetical protein